MNKEIHYIINGRDQLRLTVKMMTQPSLSFKYEKKMILKETLNSYFCATPKSCWLMFFPWKS